MGLFDLRDKKEYDYLDEIKPEPPKRNKQANQYFWRQHYLSIIQEEEEEQSESEQLPSKITSIRNLRPASCYENYENTENTQDTCLGHSLFINTVPCLGCLVTWPKKFFNLSYKSSYFFNYEDLYKIT